MNVNSKIYNTIIARGLRPSFDAPKDGTWIYATFGSSAYPYHVVWDEANKIWFTGDGVDWNDCWMDGWYEIP